MKRRILIASCVAAIVSWTLAGCFFEEGGRRGGERREHEWRRDRDEDWRR